MGVYEKLIKVQCELKAPKGQYNSFGKYHYRSCEDILEGLKPALSKNKATLVLSDSIEIVNGRFYVKATATFIDTENGDKIENCAYARESEIKKGMDDSQITGATSSYARKYALNGLFLIDDTKDADTEEYQNQQDNAKTKTTNKNDPVQQPVPQKTEEQLNQEMVDSVDKRLIPTADGKMSEEQYSFLLAQIERTGAMEDVVKYANTEDLSTLSSKKCVAILIGLLKRPDKK